MKKLVFIVLIFSFSTAWGQESMSLPQGLSLKLQSRIVRSVDGELLVNDLNVNRINPIYPAITYLSESGHIHLIEVSKFDWDSFELVNATSNNLQFSMTYEYAFPLSFVLSENKWRPYLGLGINHFATRFWLSPRDPSIFAQRSFGYRSDVYVVPSIYRIINERLFFDIAIQIHVSTLEGFRFENEAPMSPGPTNVSELRSVLFRKFGGRFGFGVKL